MKLGFFDFTATLLQAANTKSPHYRFMELTSGRCVATYVFNWSHVLCAM